MGLRVFTNHVDLVVAESEQDAFSVLEKETGVSRADLDDEFEPEPDDKLLTIWLDSPPGVCDCQENVRQQDAKIKKEVDTIDKLPDSPAKSELRKGISKQLYTFPNGHLRTCEIGSKTMTCAQWALENGRGFLASTEY